MNSVHYTLNHLVTGNSEANHNIINGPTQPKSNVNLATALSFAKVPDVDNTVMLEPAKSVPRRVDREQKSKVKECLKALGDNPYKEIFSEICDKETPEWKKYLLLYSRLGKNILVDHSAISVED